MRTPDRNALAELKLLEEAAHRMLALYGQNFADQMHMLLLVLPMNATAAEFEDLCHAVLDDTATPASAS